MTPYKFDGVNVLFMTEQTGHIPLPAFIDFADNNGPITCCWKLTVKERIKLLFTGKLWQQVLTFRQPLQPFKLSTDELL